MVVIDEGNVVIQMTCTTCGDISISIPGAHAGTVAHILTHVFKEAGIDVEDTGKLHKFAEGDDLDAGREGFKSMPTKRASVWDKD